MHAHPRTQGFTLIELLVVIAIIGLLSSVVLASLNAARSKGTDAAVKSNVNNARAQAELFYDANNNSYVNLCTNTTVGGVKSIYSNVLAAANSVGITVVSVSASGATTRAVCNSAAGYWSVQVPLKATAGTFYCADSSGYATTTATNRITVGNDYDCST